jgi:hypothetical protein
MPEEVEVVLDIREILTYRLAAHRVLEADNMQIKVR